MHVPVANANPSTQPEAPDAGGFLRLRGWGVCVPSQEWAQHGAWVIDGVMAALQPARWHSWGIWPATDIDGRVPGVFSDQYFNRDATRQYLIDHQTREWMLFNEPEVPGQAGMTPELAVDVTLEFIDLARSTGTEWQWMAPSVTLDTEHNGLEWLTEYMLIMRRRKGIMRPGSWGVHPYNCGTVADLRQSMRQWRTWHEVWGSGAPTVITEVCAEGAGVAGQMLVMNECAAMLDLGEVAGVAWASAYLAAAGGVPWQHYPLCVLDTETQTVTPTDLGRRWKELQNGME
ncbi:MAG: hypothetical protein IPL70_13255 [Uliginosibacterium sp.]|nr:hypothetical protein [Uliginosibacterium sp.]